MEKKMEKMKKEIKTQNRFYLIIAALFLIAQCTNTSGVLTSAYTNPHSAEFVHGFVLGLVIVVEIFVILQFCKNSKALKDEALLKRLYNERHDERAQQIEALASQKSVQIALILASLPDLLSAILAWKPFLVCLVSLY